MLGWWCPQGHRNSTAGWWGPKDGSGGGRMQLGAPHPLHPKNILRLGPLTSHPMSGTDMLSNIPLTPCSASPWQWSTKWGFCPQTPHSQELYPAPSPRWRASSCQSVPIPPLCFVQGFLLLLLLPLPSPAHYYYDFILMQKRFHKRPLSLPRGAGPTPASLECSPAAKWPWTGPAQGRAAPHIPLGMLA